MGSFRRRLRLLLKRKPEAREKTRAALRSREKEIDTRQSRKRSGLLYAKTERALHGDDASAVSANFAIVCDGVGGSQAASGPLAQALVEQLVEELIMIDNVKQYKPLTKQMLLRAVNAAVDRAIGSFPPYPSRSSTLSVMYLDRKAMKVYCITVGDSKTVILRDNGSMVFESTSSVFGFNVPVIISTAPTKHIGPVDFCEEAEVHPDDKIITFSDGVSDNLWLEDLQALVKRCSRKGVAQLAYKIAESAQKKATKNGVHPFAASAARSYQEVSSLMDQQYQTEESQLHKRMSEYLMSQISKKTPLDKEMKLAEYSLEHYTQDELQCFAKRKIGKSDDISVCVVVV